MRNSAQTQVLGGAKYQISVPHVLFSRYAREQFCLKQFPCGRVQARPRPHSVGASEPRAKETGVLKFVPCNTSVAPSQISSPPCKLRVVIPAYDVVGSASRSAPRHHLGRAAPRSRRQRGAPRPAHTQVPNAHHGCERKRMGYPNATTYITYAHARTRK